MCADCGCSQGSKATVTEVKTGRVSELWRGVVERLQGAGVLYDRTQGRARGHEHDRDHDHHHHGADHDHSDHEHGHSHDHDHTHTHTHDHGHNVVDLERGLLEKNDALAAQNRAWLSGREVLMLNLVSSPGSGKTSLLERTIRDLKDRHRISVIEGDQATLLDGERIDATGAEVVQVNTGVGCHLEADMIKRGLDTLRPKSGSIVMVENVGNLVCPAMFDLGEKAKVAILSVTEGEDKPLKYPHMFRAAQLILLNKTDLLPYLDFDVDKAIDYGRKVNPDAAIIQTSVKTGEGMAEWYGWIEARLAEMCC
jgi:hydrogenase nickel incorporation protein HypB